jgi:hypothetical protein
VSKAIVQAVEQQGGRFLEHEKATGLWYVVPYKRAVDKTSQGLRERDRDLDDDDNERVMDPAQVPESFQGKSNAGPTNLSDLAAVAVAHANANVNGTRSQSFQVQPGYGGLQQGYVQLPQGLQLLVGQQGTGTQLSGNKRTFSDASSYSNKRGRLDHQGASMISTYPQPTSLEARQSSIFRFMKQTQLQYLPGSNGSVSLEPSSHSATLAALSTPAYPTKLNNLSANNTQKYKRTADARGMYAVAPPLGPTQFQIPDPTQFQISDSLLSPSTFFEAQPIQTTSAPPPVQQSDGPPAQQSEGNDAPLAAPPLSRLTTQISDWLTSFWPLQGKAEAEQTGQAGYPSDPLDGDPFESESPEVAQQIPRYPGHPGSLRQTNRDNNAQSKSFAQQMPTNRGFPSSLQQGSSNDQSKEGLPFPNSRLPAEIQHQIKIPAPFNLEACKPVIVTVPPPSKSPPAPSKPPHSTAPTHSPQASKAGKRKNRANLPPLPYDTDEKAAYDLSVLNPGVIPHQRPTLPSLQQAAAPAQPPGQLETSVSTTFLKLASSPSRLLAGLTSFFDRPSTTATGPVASVDGSGFGANQLGAGIAEAPTSMQAQGIAMPRRGSKSTKSLLDDDEDTPMEARLRTIPGPIKKPF